MATAMPLLLGCAHAPEQCLACYASLLLLCFSGGKLSSVRASILSLPVDLHSAVLYCYYFGYPLLSKGGNRVSTKIEILTGSFLNMALSGSMEGQGKVETAGSVSQPPTA